MMRGMTVTTTDLFTTHEELLNSALEATVDRIGLERHPLSGIAKELGSAAVFLTFVLLAVNWLLVLSWPR